jgi:hypothetical protein
LDTREKLVLASQWGELFAEGEWLIVAGFFDPLTAQIAHRFATLAAEYKGRNILALVLESDTAHLPAAARAALVAALRCVRHVSIGSLSDLPQPSSRIPVLVEAERDKRETQEFVNLVLRRQELEKAVSS